MKPFSEWSSAFFSILVFLLTLIPKPGFAELRPAQFQIPQINTPPTLDGKLQKGEWSQCQDISDFVFWTLDSYEKDPVTAHLGFDTENFYVAFHSTYSDPETWNKRYEEKKPIDSHLWGRNNVRVQLGNGDVSIHIIATPSLSRADFKNGDMAWNGDWEFATSVGDDHWIIEIKIPFSELDLTDPPINEPWDLTLGRTHPSDARASLWNGKVLFSNSVTIIPEIKRWPVPAPGDNDLNFDFKNVGKTSEKVNCEIELIPFKGKPDFVDQRGQGPNSRFILPLTDVPIRFNQTVIIAPGKEKIVPVNYHLPKEGSYYATATCYANDGNIMMRNRGFWFALTPNGERLKALTRLLSEGLAGCRKIPNPVAGDLTEIGKTMLQEVSKLSSETSDAWSSKSWSALTEKIDKQEVKVYQYLNRLRYASLNGWEGKSDFGVTSTHSLNKIRRDSQYMSEITDRIEISAAQNEYESFQVAVLPFGADVEEISLMSTDLVDDRGNRIPNSSVEISLVEYNLIDRQPNYIIDYEGWHPDPLMPLNTPVTIKGSEVCRPFWITVYVPENTPAGNYKGLIDIQANGTKKHAVTLNLSVWDFGLPTESHLKTHTWDNLELFNEFYNVEEFPIEWYLNFCEVLLKNRFSPGFAGVNYLDQKPDAQGKFDFSKVERVLDFCMERGLTRYSMIQMRKGFYTPEEKEEVFHFIHEYAKFLREKGWLDKAVIEVWDEPTVVRVPAVIERARELREMDPDLRLQLFAFGHKEFDFWKPEAKQYGLVDLIDVWAPFPLIESPESQADGTEIWSYFCTLARHNAPNFYVDRPAIYQRTIGWHSWMFGIDAFEHWSTNYFWRNTFVGKPMAEKWPNALWDSRTFMDFSGEGQLVYPGPEGQCIPSIRLEVFRDGLDDYEYLYLLNDLIEKCEHAQIEVDLNPYRQLLKVEEYLLVKYPEDFTTTQENTIRFPERAEKYFDARQTIARSIIGLQEILQK